MKKILFILAAIPGIVIPIDPIDPPVMEIENENIHKTTFSAPSYLRIVNFSVDKNSFSNNYLNLHLYVKGLRSNGSVEIILKNKTVEGWEFDSTDSSTFYKYYEMSSLNKNDRLVSFRIPKKFLGDHNTFTFTFTYNYSDKKSFSFDLSNYYVSYFDWNEKPVTISYKAELKDSIVYEYYDFVNIGNLDYLMYSDYFLRVNLHDFAVAYKKTEEAYKGSKISFFMYDYYRFYKDIFTYSSPLDNLNYGLDLEIRNKHLATKNYYYLNTHDYTMRSYKNGDYIHRVSNIYFPKEHYYIFNMASCYILFRDFGHYKKTVKFDYYLKSSNRFLENDYEVVGENGKTIDDSSLEEVII